MWSSLPWFGWHVAVAIFFPFAAPYLNMGPLTKATIAVIQLALWVEKVRNSWVFNFLRNVGTWINSYHTLSTCFWGYVNNGTFCEEMTPGEVFSQPLNQFFGPTPSIFEGFKFPLNTNHLLLIGLLYLAFKDKLRLAWISTRTPAPETRDPAPEPDMAPESRVPTPEPDPAPEPDTAPDTRDPAPQTDTAQQSTSEMDYPNWVGVLAKGMQEMCQEMGQVRQGICQEMGQVRQEICQEMGQVRQEMGQEMGQVRQEICQLLREYTSSASEKPSPCPKEGESDGAAVEPTDVTTVQASAEPQGQPQPAAVAPVQRRKYKTKSVRPVNDDGQPGPSQPAGEPEPEVITESLSHDSLRAMRNDIVRRGREPYTTWLLRVWDLMGTSVQLDSGEARYLGSLTQDPGVDQIFVREPGPLSLWERLLMSVRERFIHKERMQEYHHRMQWKTLEQGIQQLREVAILEVLFGKDGQHDNDPDKVRCTGQMMWNLARLGPSQYTTFIATIDADNTRETVGSVANRLRHYDSMINGPLKAHVSAVVQDLKEEMKEKMEEMREEMRRVSVAPVRVTGPQVRACRPPARERGYTPRAELWFFLCEHGEDMRRWDGKPTSALAARVHELKEGGTNRGGSAKVKVASASRDRAARHYRREDDMSDPLEGTSSMYAQGKNDNQG
ncbi:uncharacterized protein LOC121660630 [Corvus kubaryi]|uniref:uncharacterized protein LOC121660630 n=1 Tax=Corvus kubaryi TaxID=68294 RepID=UPI001C04C623|nr:uncharacterized protein LOC121660630 [Corvus kubaryi]